MGGGENLLKTKILNQTLRNFVIDIQIYKNSHPILTTGELKDIKISVYTSVKFV